MRSLATQRLLGFGKSMGRVTLSTCRLWRICARPAFASFIRAASSIRRGIDALIELVHDRDLRVRKETRDPINKIKRLQAGSAE